MRIGLSRAVWSGPPCLQGGPDSTLTIRGRPHASVWVNNVIAKRFQFYYLLLCHYDL